MSEHEELLRALMNISERLDAINEKLATQAGGTSERVSSAEVKTSARGVDITTKSYVGSPIDDAVRDAVHAYYNAQGALEALQAGKEEANAR